MSESDKEQSAKAELKKRLTPMQYHVTQEKGTERYGYSWKVITTPVVLLPSFLEIIPAVVIRVNSQNNR
jgi:hypothetical protein